MRVLCNGYDIPEASLALIEAWKQVYARNGYYAYITETASMMHKSFHYDGTVDWNVDTAQKATFDVSDSGNTRHAEVLVVGSLRKDKKLNINEVEIPFELDRILRYFWSPPFSGMEPYRGGSKYTSGDHTHTETGAASEAFKKFILENIDTWQLLVGKSPTPYLLAKALVPLMRPYFDRALRDAKAEKASTRKRKEREWQMKLSA